jgi:diguanylate cyclase (GGDEF)-like protein
VDTDDPAQLRARLAEVQDELDRTRSALSATLADLQTARHCPLTGLPTRALFLASAPALLRPGRAVALLDINDFKGINDTRGHAAGDEVLAEFGTRLASWSARGDYWARLGGDEFAGVLDLSGLDWAAKLHGLMTGLRAPIDITDPATHRDELGDYTVSVRASIGLAPVSLSTNLRELMRGADLAMYRAKMLAGGWTIYNPTEDGDFAVVPFPRSRARFVGPRDSSGGLAVSCSGNVGATSMEIRD